MKTQSAPPRQEEHLVDYAKRLENNRRGRVALHIRLSGLHPFNRKDHHLRLAAAAFEPFLRKYQGQLFQLANADLVYVGKGVEQGHLKELLGKIRAMFRDDPFVQHTDVKAGFLEYFDLETAYKPFLARAMWLKNACSEGTPPRRAGDAHDVSYVYRPSVREEPEARLPLDAETLVQFEKFLQRIPLPAIVRRHFIYAVAEHEVPRPVISKFYVSIPDLQDMALPDYDLKANPWLYQHCETRLEEMIIKGFQKLEIGDELPINIEMHMSSIFLDAFLPFITEIRTRTGNPVLVDVVAMDALANMQSFSLARNFLNANRQKITISELDPLLFSAFDTSALRADLYKVRWSGQQKDWLHLHARESQLFAKAVQAVGPGLIVLTNCDCPESMTSGLTAGIRLFQGPFVDFLAASGQVAEGVTAAA